MVVTGSNGRIERSRQIRELLWRENKRTQKFIGYRDQIREASQ